MVAGHRLVATLAVMQGFSAFEGQKRTTSGNADAQTNGTVALFAISRNIQRAGFGLFPAEDSAYECANAALTPIEITDGGSNPDTITIRYGTSQYGGAPTTVISPSTAMTITNKGGENVAGDNTLNSVITVRNNLGCQAGDAAILINGSACQLSGVIDTSVKVEGDADYSAFARHNR
jgi:type IV pilus assembly protein PilW